MKQLAAILFTLSLSTVARANPSQATTEDTIEHFESRVRTTDSTRTTTTETPTRAVVEHASSSTYDEDWSSATYWRTEWRTEEGHRSDELRDQKTTIRSRARPIRVVPRPIPACTWGRCCDE